MLLTVSEELDQGASIDSMRAWLVTLARLGALGYRKQARRRSQREVLLANTETLDVPARTPDPERQAMAWNGLHYLQELVDGLSQEQREVWLLYEGSRLEVTEVAAVLDIPDGTAARRLHDARKSLDAGVRRLKARLVHRGQALGVVPLPLLFEAMRSRALPVEEGNARESAWPAVPRLTLAARWVAAQLPAFAIGAVAAMAISAAMARRDPSREEPISAERVAAVAESAPAAPPALVNAAAVSAPIVPPPVAATGGRQDLGIERVQALLDTARASLKAGHASEAMGVLDRLEQRDHRRLLGTQPELTRIEALVALGRLPEARLRAAQLRQAAPGAPALKRLTSLLDAAPGAPATNE